MNTKKWNKKGYNDYLKYLKSITEKDYRDFSKKLIDTRYEILGIRLPKLRSIAKEIIKTDYRDYLTYNNPKSYEEIMIRGFVIAYSKSEEILDKYLYEQIDNIDNWSTCDSFCNSIKLIIKGKEKYFNLFKELTTSKKEYYIRVGLITILNTYTDSNHIDEIFKILDNIELDTYYVNMASAWLLCECFIKQRDKTLKYLKRSKLNKFSFNKGIQKCRESYRVSIEDKTYLKSLKK